MTYNSNLSTKLAKIVLAVFAIWFISLLVLTCSKAQEEIHLAPSYIKSNTVIRPAHPLIIQPGDTIYRPIAWGAELRVVPGVIYAGNHPKFGKYWFTKSMAYSRVKPANYMQDSIRERVAFADSILITNLDTFYICRRMIL